MPVFLVSATDERGKRETHRVDADNSQDAYRDMESRGFTQIVLHTDDAAATASAMFPHDPNVEEHVSAADMVKFQSQTTFGFFLHLLKWLSWKMIAGLTLAGIVLYYNLKNQRGITSVEIRTLIFLLLALILALWGAYFSSSRKYTLLMDAFAWGRWQEVLDRAASLQGQMPDFELTCRESVALAALGQSDEALAKIEVFIDDPEVPLWMYYGRLSEVYEVLDEEEKYFECLRRSYEDAPENPTVQIDYAYGLMKHQLDHKLAKQLIDDAEQQHLAELVKMLLNYFKGLLHLNQGAYKLAEDYFRKAHIEMQPMAPAQPLLQLFVDLNRAYLAITLAERGDFAQAESLYQQAYPRLKALDTKLVMDRYAAVMAR